MQDIYYAMPKRYDTVEGKPLFGTGLSAQSVHNIVKEAIGGPAWIAEFGSSDEFADYAKYAVEHPQM